MTTSLGASARRLAKGVVPPSIRRAANQILCRDRFSIAEYEKRYNLNQIQRYEMALNRQGRTLSQFATILDFACGAGRLTQYLPWLAPRSQIFGCDIDSVAINKCRQRCPSGNFCVNSAAPPLSYPDDQFDLIWSYSIFTNLSEPSHVAWLQELARTLRPGGIMMHTAHSYEYLRRMVTFAPERLDKYHFPKGVAAFLESETGYYFTMDNPASPDYGVAIISQEYVINKWPRLTGLEPVDYLAGAIEAYPEGCQDIVVLRKGA